MMATMARLMCFGILEPFGTRFLAAFLERLDDGVGHLHAARGVCSAFGVEVGASGAHEPEADRHFFVLAAHGALLCGAVDFHALDAPFHHVLDEFVGEARLVGVREHGDSARVFDEADGLLRVEALLFDEGDASVAEVLGERFGEIPDVFLVHQRHGDVRAPDDFTLAVGMDLLVGDVDAERVEFLDDRLYAGDALFCEILEFHVQGEVRRVAEVPEDMDVLALPDGRNLDARDEFEPELLGLVFGQLVRVQVVVVGYGDAAKPLALRKREEFLYRKSAVGKTGMQVQVRISTAFGDDCPTVHLPTP